MAYGFSLKPMACGFHKEAFFLNAQLGIIHSGMYITTNTLRTDEQYK
jgi:hypothetical protein